MRPNKYETADTPAKGDKMESVHGEPASLIRDLCFHARSRRLSSSRELGPIPVNEVMVSHLVLAN